MAIAKDTAGQGVEVTLWKVSAGAIRTRLLSAWVSMPSLLACSSKTVTIELWEAWLVVESIGCII